MHKQVDYSNSLFPKTSEGLLVDALFSSIGDGAIATDEFGNITRVNSTALSILGYKEKELVGKWFLDKIVAFNEDGSVVPNADRAITDVFTTGRSVSGKTYYGHKGGHKIPVSITASPMIVNHLPIGAINLFRDISQEYEIDRMKSEFISLASHQLRTPLATIKTYSHMIAEGYMGDLTLQQYSVLQTILEAADKMNQLTDTLLKIARMESGFMTIAEKITDVGKLTKNLMKVQHLAATEKHLDLSFHAPKDLPKAITDTFIAEEIISNLISNAIKYTPAGGKITVRLKVEGKNLVCVVSDTGIGIPKSAQKKIFSKFFRAPNAVSRDTTGTGLGLYLVKEMSDQMNARVWFESEEGKGSTFYFSLPIWETDQPIANREKTIKPQPINRVT